MARRADGGTGPSILIRRVWVGEPPGEQVERQVDVYRSYAKEDAQQRWQGDQLAGGADTSDVAATLADATTRAGADALNLRVQVPGVSPEAARAQIVRLGDEVLHQLRNALA